MPWFPPLDPLNRVQVPAGGGSSSRPLARWATCTPTSPSPSACRPGDTMRFSPPVAITEIPSHHPVVRPRIPPSRVVLLVLGVDRLVDGLRIEGGVNVLQEGDDVGVALAQAADLGVVLVDVCDVQLFLPNAHPPQRPH